MAEGKRTSPVVPVIGCLIVQLCVGIIYLWSVFKSSVVASYGWVEASATMVASYMMMGFVLGCLFGGLINDKKGPRFSCVIGIILFSLGVGLTGLLRHENIGLIYLTYSVMGGLGAGLTYNACIPCIQKWMPDRRGLASGLAAAAFGLSCVVFAPVSRALMTRFTDAGTGLVSFRPVFLILGAVFLVIGLIGCSLIRLPSSERSAAPRAGAPAVSKKDYTIGEAVKTVPFWCIFFMMFFINGTWNLTMPMIYDLGISRGLTVALATLAVSFTGIPNAAGRLIMAYVSDRIGRVPTLIILSAATVIAALCMCFVGGIWYIVTVGVIAFCFGGPSPVNAAFCTDFFGPKNAGTNYGVLMLALGLSSVFFNFMSKKVLGGAITPTFIMAAVTAVISIICMLIIRKYLPSAEKKD
ncbi:MAG: MFS transporter [Oscillospiraceae bacterium]|nr:MFS transporter [Oscillospiraceae bacterium]